ncbi:MAG: helix-turn-helix domain-containing protein [bacterium]|nr:helix-turn-helix domain-containing protein [bacterium]
MSNPPAESTPQLLDVTRLAQFLGVSATKLRRMRHARELPPPVSLSGSVLWSKPVVDDWLKAGCPRMPGPVTRKQPVAYVGKANWAIAKGFMVSDDLKTATFRNAWEDWVVDRVVRRKPPTDRAVKLQIRKLEAMGHDNAILSIKNSIANGWTGLFEPEKPHAGKQAGPEIAGDDKWAGLQEETENARG